MDLKQFSQIEKENLVAAPEISEADFFKAEEAADSPLTDSSIDNEQEIKDEPIDFDANDAQPRPQPQYGANGIGQNVKANNIISANIAFSLVDNLIPVAIVYLLSMADVKSRKSEFKASKDEADTIKGVLDNCLKQMNVNFDNPFIALGVVLAGVYGSKALEIYVNREKEPSKPEAAPKSNTGRGRPTGSKNKQQSLNL